MRPRSILRFEQAAYGSLGLSLIGMLTEEDAGSLWSPSVELPLSYIIVLDLVAFGLSLLLIWLIARRANRVAKWIFVLLAAASLAFQLVWPEWVFEIGGSTAAIIFGQDLLIVCALWMLFRPESSAWFKGEYVGPDAEVFR